jgi:hypothetical protein
VKELEGGVLSAFSGVDKSAAARLLSLMKGSIQSLWTEDGEEYKMEAEDYGELFIPDTWKIGYEQIKCITGEEYPIIPENFYCGRCSTFENERYTSLNENWQKLIEKGLIDEFFSDDGKMTYEVTLPVPFEIQGNRTVGGGVFNKIIRKQITINDACAMQKDPKSIETQAAHVYATWDRSIVSVVGLSERELNILKRSSDEFFSKRFIAVSQANIDAMNDADAKLEFGISAKDRKVACRVCGNEIGGSLDFTNFFSALSRKKSPLPLSKTIEP